MRLVYLLIGSQCNGSKQRMVSQLYRNGVYPKLVQIAEKITNDILPSYGDNLIGESEDISTEKTDC